ncbi:hypothetical protein JTE90_024736 [Oedothorax gibbosus]|uniref:ZSWIM1/3 RNaseH-like domain-containing protein n=1 Tax=Oedothorax gibbosus TaxID=931172 RepID=A0AAV6UB92_9ARAC|nr:hypothetical protein JTE90_024736 [Oedothorax gibbosus]
MPLSVGCSLAGSFNRGGSGGTRCDDLFIALIGKDEEFCHLLSIMKMVLTFSHKNASVESGFSINKNMLVENLHEKSLAALRKVYDCIKPKGGIESVQMSEELHAIQIGANKKLLQSELLKTSRVTLADRHNLNRPEKEDTSKAALTYLQQKDAIVEIVKNDDNVLLGIKSQDSVIHLCCRRWQWGIRDSGFFFISAIENKPTITKMVQIFKKHNAAWAKTRSVMIDKDFLERNAFSEQLPQAYLLICLFHCLRTFRMEITIVFSSVGMIKIYQVHLSN